MTHINRIVDNLVAYVEEDMVPKMPKLEGIAFAALAPFVVKAKVMSSVKLIGGTELMDGDNVDVDSIYREIKVKASGKWPVELMGFSFREDDLDKLYRYITR